MHKCGCCFCWPSAAAPHLLQRCEEGPCAEPLVQVGCKVLAHHVPRAGRLPPDLHGPHVGAGHAQQGVPAAGTAGTPYGLLKLGGWRACLEGVPACHCPATQHCPCGWHSAPSPTPHTHACDLLVTSQCETHQLQVSCCGLSRACPGPNTHLMASSCCLYTTNVLTSFRLSNTCMPRASSIKHNEHHRPADPLQCVPCATHLDDHQPSVVVQAQQGLEQPARACNKKGQSHCEGGSCGHKAADLGLVHDVGATSCCLCANSN